MTQADMTLLTGVAASAAMINNIYPVLFVLAMTLFAWVVFGPGWFIVI